MEEKKLENKLVNRLEDLFFGKKMKYLSYVLIGVMFAIVALWRFSFFSNKNEHEEKISRMETAFLEWKQDSQNVAKFIKLKDSLKKNSDISCPIQGEVIQTLLFNKDLRAKEFALPILNKIKDEYNYFSTFSNISLLINENKLEEALKSSEELKTLLEKEEKSNLTIYPYNLLRISFISKKIQNQKSELEGWNALEKYISEKKDVARTFIEELEKEIKFNLVEYIQLRKEELTSS